MPELPELEVLRENLMSQIDGKEIQLFRILKPYILKNYFTGDLSGERIENIQRRGKFLLITLTEHNIIIHLMMRGSIKYVLPSKKMRKTSAAQLIFDDGTLLELSESGHKKMMSLHILTRGGSLQELEKLGIDPLEKDFTTERLKKLLKSEAQQLKSFLRDQRKIAGIGNAYADEILWKAGLSPFKNTTKLNDTEITNLRQSIVDILKWAIAKIRNRGISERRDFLHIHQKRDKPCPRCSAPIQIVSFSHSDTFYCPQCQTKGRRFKDRRLSKLYR